MLTERVGPVRLWGQTRRSTCGNRRITDSRSGPGRWKWSTSLSASAAARQERAQSHCRVRFARAFADRSRARPRASGTRRVHLSGHPKTEEVFVQNGLEFRVSFVVKCSSSCIVRGVGTPSEWILCLIIIMGWGFAEQARVYPIPCFSSFHFHFPPPRSSPSTSTSSAPATVPPPWINRQLKERTARFQ